jgi:hypothetical protein
MVGGVVLELFQHHREKIVAPQAGEHGVLIRSFFERRAIAQRGEPEPAHHARNRNRLAAA